MPQLHRFLLSVASLSLLSGTLQPVMAADGPTVVQRSLILNVEDTERYWPDPKKDPIVGKPSWIPHNDYIHFVIVGPLSGDAELSMEFTKPGGKPWIQLKCFNPGELAEGQVADVNCNTVMPEQAAIETGVFGVRIHYQAPGSDAKSELFKGSFKVANYVNRDSKKPNYAIVEDWRVPLAYVALDTAAEPNTPTLYSYFWFKSRSLEWSDLVAQLYYQGQPVAISTDDNNNASLVFDRHTFNYPADPKLDNSYQFWKFTFAKVHGHVNDPDSYNTEGWHTLAEHPGEYEIRVTHKGELVRTASFSVGSDGQIQALGSAEKDSNGNLRVLVPAKVSGKADLAWDKASYKTDVYYGNPGPSLLSVIAP